MRSDTMDIIFNNMIVGKVLANKSKIINSLNLPLSINFKSASDKVDDEIRGYLVYNGIDWIFHLSSKYNPKTEFKKIALILESPHEKEYDRSKIPPTPIAPAQGSTGIRIRRYICKYCLNWNLNNNTIYEVKIMNSIQYQTSCYNELIINNPNYNLCSSLRNQVFKLLWNSSANDLVKRINRYNPDIIINACTGGNDRYGLRNIVKQLIATNLNITQYLEYHPSRWH